MRKYVLMATVAAVAGITSSAAFAADPTPPPVMAYNWTGFYLGGDVGWAWLDTGAAQGPGPGSVFIQKDSDGVMGGGYAGYNFEIAPSWILGIEGDFSGTDLDNTVPCNNPLFACNASADWTASVRGRVGFAVDRALIYGTGGIAWLDYSGFTAIGGLKFSDSNTMTGWTAGGGIEWAFTDNFIARAEYLYSDFGSHTMKYDVGYRVDPTLSIFRLGLSYKF